MVDKKKSSISGFSAPEMIVAVAISAGALVLGTKLWLSGQKAMTDSVNSMVNESNLQIISGNLQKFMPSGDISFFGFSGNGSATPADRVLGRVLIPRPAFCRDLTTLGCEQDVAFFYVHYDKTTTPAATVVCAFDADNLLVDIANNTYGNATLEGDGILVAGSTAFPNGKIPIADGQLLSTLDPPNGSLWRATGAATAFTFTKNNAGIIVPALPAGSGCTSHFSSLPAPPGAPTPYTNFVKVPVAPFIMTTFTGGTTVSAVEVASAYGRFPVRIFATSLRVIGRLSGDNTFGVRSCSFVGGVMACGGSDVLVMKSVAQFRVQEVFSLKLSAPTFEKYELLSPAQIPSEQCPNTHCAALPIANSAQIPVLSSATETFLNLDATSFSLLKQEFLRKMRFLVWVVDNQNQRKLETFDVSFP